MTMSIHDPKRIHEEMLRHLHENPPQDDSDPPEDTSEAAPPSLPRRPRLMLRKLPLELAMQRLEAFLREKHHQCIPEVVVVVGRGKGSPDGQSVIGPAARELCRRHPDLVASVETAKARDGGEGALWIRLNVH